MSLQWAGFFPINKEFDTRSHGGGRYITEQERTLQEFYEHLNDSRSSTTSWNDEFQALAKKIPPSVINETPEYFINKEPSLPLLMAVQKKKERAVHTLLAQDALVDKSTYYHAAPIHEAAKSGTATIFKLLLDKLLESAKPEEKETEKCVDFRNTAKQTCLHLIADRRFEADDDAALKEWLEIVDSLLEKGADIDAQDKYGNTALHYAVSCKSNVALIKKLIDSGAKLEIRNHAGETPFLHAVTSLGVDSHFLTALIAAGCKVTVENNKKETPLHHIVRNSIDYNMINTIAQRIEKEAKDKINQRNDEGKTAILEAAKGLRLEAIDILLKHGANVNMPDNQDITALHELAKQYRVTNADIQRFIKAGAKVDSADKNGVQPIHLLAAQSIDGSNLPISSRIDSIDSLLKAGVEIEAKDNQGRTPLLYAAQHGHLDILKHLINKGADPLAADYAGNSIIHYGAIGDAISRSQPEKILFLKGLQTQIARKPKSLDYLQDENLPLLPSSQTQTVGKPKMLLNCHQKNSANQTPHDFLDQYLAKNYSYYQNMTEDPSYMRTIELLHNTTLGSKGHKVMHTLKDLVRKPKR